MQSDHEHVEIVHLAAGVGSRLGKPFPKPLTPLGDGESILARQHRLMAADFPESRNIIVVGFKKDMILEALPDSLFVYNNEFGETNTSKSLVRALKATGHEPVLWMNGDVVFGPGLVGLVAEGVAANDSFVCVNTASVGEEEVKYNVDEQGMIRDISKAVEGPLGEAVGINYVASKDKEALIEHLEACSDDDYFERGIETAIAAKAMTVRPLDISAFPCIEVDFAEDLDKALATFS